MKSITNSELRSQLEKRISSVDATDQAKWGIMNSHQMVCHCADQLRLAVGSKQARFVGNKFTTTLLKNLVLIGMPVPKGKVETMPEIKQGVGGTPPVDFDKDKLDLINLINSFERFFKNVKNGRHPVFGNMNYKQWSRLAFIHLDYHLKQFGR